MLFDVGGFYKSGEAFKISLKLHNLTGKPFSAGYSNHLPPDRSPTFLRYLAAEMGHKLKLDFPVDGPSIDDNNFGQI